MKTTHQPAFAGKICGFDFLLLKNILKYQKTRKEFETISYRDIYFCI